ncbi:putative bifunctional diguanylate cyclase/phosphodiesterase [Bacillales bacterium AN1005]
MNTTLINQQPNFLFYLIYIILSLGALLLTNKLRKRDPKSRYIRIMTFLFILTSISTILLGQRTQNIYTKREQDEYRYASQHLGIILAQELRSSNHEDIDRTSNRNNRLYKEIYNQLLSWQKSNKEIQSLYTLKNDKKETYYFLFAPETDYNKDGVISGHSEESVPIGTLYHEDLPELKRAFSGEFTMQLSPTTDAWSTSITAYVPILNSKDKVDAVLGIDYDGNIYNIRLEEERIKIQITIITILLIEVLLYVIAILRELERIKVRKHKNELKQLAYYDSSTHLPNKHYTYKFMNLKESENAAIIYLTIEGYQKVVNLMDFSKGEEFILENVRRISSLKNITLIRWGETDFLIVYLNFRRKNDVLPTLIELIDVLAKPVGISGRNFDILPKVGVSYYPLNGNDWATLIKKADLAKSYYSDENQKFYLFNDSILDNLQKRNTFESDLRKALLEEQFELYYQVQIDLLTEKPIGMESLLRWYHPTIGLISPMEFIHIAEEIGLIEPLSLWIFKKACYNTKLINDEYNLNLRISVNLSPVHLKNPSLYSDILAILKETGLKPEFLDIEITENAIIDIKNSIKTLKTLKTLGVNISMDDFGSGFSSLGYLQHLPIDRLKMDRLFIKDFPYQNDNLIKSIIDLGHNLKLKVLAEGAENKEQVELLRKLGCNEVQGYYYSKPLPIEDFKKLLISFL